MSGMSGRLRDGNCCKYCWYRGLMVITGIALRRPDKTGHWTKRLSPWRDEDAMLMWGESIQFNKVFSAAGEPSENSIYIVCAPKTHNRFRTLGFEEVGRGAETLPKVSHSVSRGGQGSEQGGIHFSKNRPGINATSERTKKHTPSIYNVGLEGILWGFARKLGI